jgi:hypothetical protein
VCRTPNNKKGVIKSRFQMENILEEDIIRIRNIKLKLTFVTPQIPQLWKAPHAS